ncbi:MAG: 4Fe-4S binding protein [Thermoproteota archaeon]|nr:4Fe-4S binding protein [Thermoproteota archaeon]
MERKVSITFSRNKGAGEQLKQITILSGKGGTGKTTITASFAALAQNIVIADCDVDAPDLHLLLHPKIMQKQVFKGTKLAVMDKTKCIECGECEEACRFDAITDLKIDPVLCEGCGVCVLVCPVEAISLKEKVAGYAFTSKTKYGPMSHAKLNPAEENSGKLVTLVRQNAKQIAEKENCNPIVIDGPPGIGCPVIASVSGVDMGLIVTEPTMSGIHDMERALQLLNHFHVLPFVCVNKYDINKENTKRIVEFCSKNDVKVVGKISFDPAVTEAMVMGKPVVEYSPQSVASKEIKKMWKSILPALNGK